MVVGKALIDIGMTGEANKVWEEAFLTARQIKYDIDRSHTLISLATVFSKAGNTEQSSRVLDEAVAAARHASDDLVQAEATFSARQTEIKSERAKLSRNPSRRNRMADDDPAPLGFDNDLSSSISYLTRSLSESGRADDALPIARKIQTFKSRVYALIAVAESFRQTQRLEEAKKLLSEALSTAHQILDDSGRALAMLSVAETQIEFGETDQVANTLDEALLAINHATDNPDYFQIISSIAQNMVKAGRVDAAFNAIQSIKSDTTKQYDLEDLIGEIIKSAKAEEKKSALIKSLEIARQIRNDNWRSHLIATIAKGLARLQEFRLARLTSDSCSSVDKLGVYAVVLSEYEDSKHLGSAVSPSTTNR